MKNYKIAAALIGSFVLGAGGAQMLHAQTKPAVYAIAMVNVKDQDGYMKEFLPKAQAGIKENGAEYLAGGMNKTTSFAGEQPPNRVVILKFPNAEAWKKFEENLRPLGRTRTSHSNRETCKKSTDEIRPLHKLAPFVRQNAGQ